MTWPSSYFFLLFEPFKAPFNILEALCSFPQFSTLWFFKPWGWSWFWIQKDNNCAASVFHTCSFPLVFGALAFQTLGFRSILASKSQRVRRFVSTSSCPCVFDAFVFQTLGFRTFMESKKKEIAAEFLFQKVQFPAALDALTFQLLGFRTILG